MKNSKKQKKRADRRSNSSLCKSIKHEKREKIKNGKKIIDNVKRPVQQLSRFCGRSFSHGKIDAKLNPCGKNRYETRASRSRELNNNTY